MNTKRCAKCREEKPLSEFHRNRALADGLCHYCKPCTCANSKKYSALYREKNRAQHKIPEMSICCVCHIAKGSSEFHIDRNKKFGISVRCKDCQRQKVLSDIQFYENSDKDIPNQKLCPRCGRTKSSSDFYRNKQVYDGLSSHCKICMREYEKTTSGHDTRLRYLRGAGKIKSQENWHRYYSKKKSLDWDFDDSDWIYCLEWWKNKCAYCGNTHSTLQRDHFIPVSSDGPYTTMNIVPSCPRCNFSKNNNDPFSWAASPALEKIESYFTCISERNLDRHAK